jgi:hypothetical protein
MLMQAMMQMIGDGGVRDNLLDGSFHIAKQFIQYCCGHQCD